MVDNGDVGPSWQRNPDSPVYSRQQIENEEMLVLAQWLDVRGVLWCHVANEGRHEVQHRAAQAKRGVKKGVPDVLIFTPPPKWDGLGPARGCALELKAGKGRATPEQQAWLEALAAQGWATAVKVGASAAIQWLGSLGY